MKVTLIDSNILIDVMLRESDWYTRSSSALEKVGDESALAINAIIYAEVSATFHKIEDLDNALPVTIFRRETIPYEAAFLAGRAFIKYRRQSGTRTSPLPDFYIGAHAAVSGYRILTRDPRRYRAYFPTVELIAP